MIFKALAPLCIALSLVIWDTAAYAQDFVFVRAGDPERAFRQNDALVIEVPPHISADDLASHFLELDGVDITQRVTLEGARVVFYPASPYGTGQHVLRLVRLGKNNKLVEINRWHFIVGDATEAAAAATLRGQMDATYSARVFDNIDSDLSEGDIQNFMAQGQLDAALDQAGWRLGLRGNGLLNSEDDLNPAGAAAEVGEFLLTAEKDIGAVRTAARLGNHDIGASNLLIDQFYRRGFSVGADIAQGRAQVTGFAMNPAAATGNRNMFGIDDSGQLARGAHMRIRPLQSLGDRLEIESTVYSGKGGIDGSGVGGNPAISYRGNGFQIGGAAEILKDRLALRTQYASADYDGDGAGAEPERRGEAYGISFSFTPFVPPADSGTTHLDWTIEPGYYRAGSFYRSMLNAGAESDRELWSVKSRLGYGALTLDGEVSWATDNVSDNPDLPHDRSMQAWAQGSYTLAPETWGTPVLFFGAALSDDERQKTPAGFGGDGLDRTTSSLNGGLALSFEKTSWSFNHTYSALNDREDSAAEYRSHYTDFSAEYRFNSRLTLRPGVQMEFLRDDTQGSSTNTHGSFGLQSEIIEGKLWNNTNYSMQVAGGKSSQGRLYNAETEFNWVLKPAENNSPGYAVAFSGLYTNNTGTRDAFDREDEELRLFARLKLAAPFSR